MFAELSRWLYTRTQVGAIRSVFAEPSWLLIASLVGLIIHIKLIETNASFDLTKVYKIQNGCDLNHFLCLQVKYFKKYKSSLLIIILSCPQIGSLSSSTANQRAAQYNYPALGCQDLYFLNFVTCNILKLETDVH